MDEGCIIFGIVQSVGWGAVGFVSMIDLVKFIYLYIFNRLNL